MGYGKKVTPFVCYEYTSFEWEKVLFVVLFDVT